MHISYVRRFPILLLLLCALAPGATFAAASIQIPELLKEIKQLREALKSQSDQEPTRARLAAIGWQLAEEIERAESLERDDIARAVSAEIRKKLPDIIWRTKHYAEHKNDARAQLARAVFHRTGTLLEQDETTACTYYRKAARQAHPTPAALWRYSLCAARDNQEYGRTLLQDAAEAGHPTAQQILAETWMSEQKPEMREAAVNMLQSSANSGRRSAKLLLAALYETGTILQKSIPQAEKIYRSIADEGHAVAQNNLGALYQRKGEFEEASIWYRKAAEQGLPVAQLNFGLLYTQGVAPYDNGCEAMKWIRMAADQSLEMAKKIVADPGKFQINCSSAN